MEGYSDVLVGMQAGDEGKARVIDALAPGYNVIVRYCGGPNAGHSLEVKEKVKEKEIVTEIVKKIVLHQIPSGIFHPNMHLYIGSGCVINLAKLRNEIKEVEALGISLEGRLMICDQATVILPHHLLLDRLTGKEMGTTLNGIGPTYADQALRSQGKLRKNVRLGDFLDEPEMVQDAIAGNYRALVSALQVPHRDMNINYQGENWRENWKENLEEGPEEHMEEKAKEIIQAADGLQRYICRNPLWLDSLARAGKRILFEGAQASMLDVVKGTVPYVTSSHTIAGSAYVGGDLSPKYHRKTIGVAKAIMSRVGNGPFVSEFGGAKSEEYCAQDGGKKYSKEREQELYSVSQLLQSDDPFFLGIALRMLGNEYGATTKRPRRMGMLDLRSLEYHCRLNGVDELYLNKIDCLTDFSRTKLLGIPVVTSYSLDGQKISHVPTTNAALRAVLPTIEYFPAISENIGHCRTFEELPSPAQGLVKIVEEHAHCKVAGVGVGPQREQFIRRE